MTNRAFSVAPWVKGVRHTYQVSIMAVTIREVRFNESDPLLHALVAHALAGGAR